MITCARCGQVNPDSASDCSKCHGSLPRQVPAEELYRAFVHPATKKESLATMTMDEVIKMVSYRRGHKVTPEMRKLGMSDREIAEKILGYAQGVGSPEGMALPADQTGEALAICPECNMANPAGQRFCGNCGAVLSNARVVADVQAATAPRAAVRPVGPQPAPAVQVTQTKRTSSAWWLLLLIVLACVVVYLAGTAGDGGSSSQPKTHDAVGAWVVAQNFVEDRLVSPSTAEFPCCYDDFTTHLGSGRYQVSSYVDSQNKMGAMLRTYFDAVVEWQGGDKWRLENIVFDE